MIRIDARLEAADLSGPLSRLFELAGEKIASIRKSWSRDRGTPVFTVDGVYTSRGWTEWTRGFLFGLGLLHYEATGDGDSLAFGRGGTRSDMPPHLTHMGVHDHGFNSISTYGNLLRLMKDGALPEDRWEREHCRLALAVSGAVQASRWTGLPGGLGYIYSFNGPHSLFIDTIRTLRVLAMSHSFGHFLMGEQDRRINLLERLVRHGLTTARYNVYFGEGRDAYDVRGRVSHESIFNTVSGSFRCPSSQQGYSPFTTWTRGLAWSVLGFAELLEYLSSLPPGAFEGLRAGEAASADRDPSGEEVRRDVLETFLGAARACADFTIEQTPTDGVPYWDTGAPGLARLGEYLDRPADPDNDEEPVDSSAAAIGAQGLLRLGAHLDRTGDPGGGERYTRAGLTVARSLFRSPYLSADAGHQGLLLHSIYHRPNGWDHRQPGRSSPSGESCLWGDYHALELGALIRRMAAGGSFTFFDV